MSDGVRQGAQLLVLPEMAWTGYLWPDAATLAPFAEPAGDGWGQAMVQTWADRWGVTLVYGFPESADGRLFNSQGIALPGTPPQPVYRKTHLFDADTWWATPGDTGYRQWSGPGLRLGGGICMDLNYPDLVAFHRDNDTEVLVFSTNWIDQGFDIVPYWEEQLESFSGWALFADRGGSEFGLAYRGQSAVFSNGRCVASCPGTADSVLVVDLSTSEGPSIPRRGGPR